MILRRLSEHVKAQNWFAVALDFLIVVFGVFFGFQVNNWAEDRSNKRDYKAAIERLRDEVAANFETLDLVEYDVGEELPLVRNALTALETCSDDPGTLETVNAGLARLLGTSGIALRTQALSELTTNPHLLAQQSPAVRRRLADLLFYHDIAITQAAFVENLPLEGKPEGIPVLSPGPWTENRTTYLGLVYNNDRRPLQLNVPVSAACRNTDLVAALWAWDRYQATLTIVSLKMRNEYQLSLDLLEEEAAP